LNERKIVQIAFVVSLLLHLVVAAVTWRIPFIPHADPALAEEQTREVELLLVDDPLTPEDSTDPDMPTAYAAVPDRLATEEPPEQPDYLALNHSIAADNREGGDSNTPAADEEWIQPKVEIQKEDLEGAGGDSYSTQPLPEPREGQQASEAREEEQEAQEETGQTADPVGQWALPSAEDPSETQQNSEESSETDQNQPELEDWWGGQAPSILKEGERANSGDTGFDFDQAAKGSVSSGVAIDGDFSLNTYEWDYAPWMHQFENELHRHWMAPYAYRIGVINGMTLIRLVVEKDGRPSIMEVIETQGHESLHDASVAALRAFAPYRPLPADFPEENLVITLGLHYPAWRR